MEVRSAFASRQSTWDDRTAQKPDGVEGHIAKQNPEQEPEHNRALRTRQSK